MTRLSRDDIVAGAGKRFARYGYHGTSMRDLGDDLGIVGSSIYAHIGGKQELLVAVVERGAAFFEASGANALENATEPLDVLGLLIEGHIDVLIDHQNEARTYLTEVFFLDQAEQQRIVAARDAYEQVFIDTIEAAKRSGAARAEIDPRLSAIYILSILNALERWYDEAGRVRREDLTADLTSFVCQGVCG